MTRLGGTLLFATLAATAACGVGNDPGGGTGGSDDRSKLGIVCSSSFTITGTFVAGTPGPPTDPDTGLPQTGCWPVGTWTFTAAVASGTCNPAPTVLPTYSFKVDRVLNGPDGQGQVDNYTNMTNVGGLSWHLGVSSNGQGCEGHLELGSADGKDYWQMQPALLKTAPTTLTGSGDYDRYSGDGWPWR